MIFSDKVMLADCTNVLWHKFYKSYVSDPIIDNNAYTYDYDKAQKAYYAKIKDVTRLYFFIVAQNRVIG